MRAVADPSSPALTVVLAGAELELAPAEIAGHPAVRTTARETGRRPSEVLLDQNVHGPAIRKLAEGDRRGRPDITHITLLGLLESPSNRLGHLRVLVHTRHHILLRFRPDVRLPRSEARFQGLMSKVLRDGQAQDADPLVWSEGVVEPSDVLASWTTGPVVRLDEQGPHRTPEDLVGPGDRTVVVGAFAHGDFSPSWRTAAPETASMFGASLNAWAVTGELVAAHHAHLRTRKPPASS